MLCKVLVKKITQTNDSNNKTHLSWDSPWLLSCGTLRNAESMIWFLWYDFSLTENKTRYYQKEARGVYEASKSSLYPSGLLNIEQMNHMNGCAQVPLLLQALLLLGGVAWNVEHCVSGVATLGSPNKGRRLETVTNFLLVQLETQFQEQRMKQSISVRIPQRRRITYICGYTDTQIRDKRER